MEFFVPRGAISLANGNALFCGTAAADEGILNEKVDLFSVLEQVQHSRY